MYLCLNAEMKPFYIMHVSAGGSTHRGLPPVKLELLYLHLHWPMLLSEGCNDFKVKQVGGVHDNIFRQDTVVNHLQSPLGALTIQVSSCRADGSGVGGVRSEVCAMKIDFFLQLSADPGEAESDCRFTPSSPSLSNLYYRSNGTMLQFPFFLFLTQWETFETD